MLFGPQQLEQAANEQTDRVRVSTSNLVNTVDVRQSREIRALLDWVDSLAGQTSGKAADHRSLKRRRLRAKCTIAFALGDEQSVVAVGRTRDITRDGLGAVVDQIVPNGTPARADVKLPDGQEFVLHGKLSHARSLRGAWHLVGISFQR